MNKFLKIVGDMVSTIYFGLFLLILVGLLLLSLVRPIIAVLSISVLLTGGTIFMIFALFLDQNKKGFSINEIWCFTDESGRFGNCDRKIEIKIPKNCSKIEFFIDANEEIDDTKIDFSAIPIKSTRVSIEGNKKKLRIDFGGVISRNREFKISMDTFRELTNGDPGNYIKLFTNSDISIYEGKIFIDNYVFNMQDVEISLIKNKTRYKLSTTDRVKIENNSVIWSDRRLENTSEYNLEWKN